MLFLNQFILFCVYSVFIFFLLFFKNFLFNPYWTLADTTFMDRNEPESNIMKVYFTSQRCPKMESNHQMQFSIIGKTPLFGGGLTTLQSVDSNPHHEGVCELRKIMHILELSQYNYNKNERKKKKEKQNI